MYGMMGMGMGMMGMGMGMGGMGMCDLNSPPSQFSCAAPLTAAPPG